jgi:hypothetical protein
MTYHYVKCPNFIRKDSLGNIEAVLCKICGTVIADTVDKTVGFEKTRGGQVIKVVRRQLTRFSNYCEIKIEFDDPSYFHVTHGCQSCLHIGLGADVLAELHQADQEESPDGFTDRERAKAPVKVAILQLDQSGIA